MKDKGGRVERRHIDIDTDDKNLSFQSAHNVVRVRWARMGNAIFGSIIPPSLEPLSVFNYTVDIYKRKRVFVAILLGAINSLTVNDHAAAGCSSFECFGPRDRGNELGLNFKSRPCVHDEMELLKWAKEKKENEKGKRNKRREEKRREEKREVTRSREIRR
ncbi:hypothetical protein V1477_007212 [Vespula maculifrons]|uniref:Uncharacterized protein n=1 Tax=Vespula maculifrons TaxID=7453 RepID=A0ABD2CIT2_VESMC